MENHGKSGRTKSGIVILPIFKMIARFSKCDFWIPDKILSRNIYNYIFLKIFSMKKSEIIENFRFLKIFEKIRFFEKFTPLKKIFKIWIFKF